MRIVRPARNVYSKRHWQKKAVRAIRGLVKPMRCPNCRQFTAQRQTQKAMRLCIPCEKEFTVKRARMSLHKRRAA